MGSRDRTISPTSSNDQSPLRSAPQPASPIRSDRLAQNTGLAGCCQRRGRRVLSLASTRADRLEGRWARVRVVCR